MSAPEPAPPAEAELVVVGAGVVGLCAGLFLARAGRETAVLDRGAPWGDASGANAGTLSLQVKTPRVWDLTRLALDIWARLDAELDGGLGFTRCGGLRVALDERERERLRATVDAQRRRGLDVELHEGAALRARAPWLGDDVLAAGACPDDAYASPLAAGPALVAAARASGAAVVGGCAVVGIERAGGGYRVRTGRGDVRARRLVIAAGAWSGEVAAMLGVALPVIADANMLHVTEPAAPCMDRIVTHVGGMLSLKQYPNGTCVIGGGWQGRGRAADGRCDVDHENLHHNLAIAARVVPALRGMRLVRSWGGFEALVPDALPVAGPLPALDDVWVAACARGGYTVGPAQAWIVAEQACGRAPAIDAAPFAPARLAA